MKFRQIPLFAVLVATLAASAFAQSVDIKDAKGVESKVELKVPVATAPMRSQ